MIISWFTQPKKPFSSYYQYDTVTRHFSRTRLELDRSSKSGHSNDTFVSYSKQRAVGFTNKRCPYDSEKPGQHWSVENGTLCYNGKPLPSASPRSGYRVYDTSNPQNSVHKGNAVTDTPKLPDGIGAKHLALLANDTMINKPADDITLTPATPSQSS
jgi:hypothetical protein